MCNKKFYTMETTIKERCNCVSVFFTGNICLIFWHVEFELLVSQMFLQNVLITIDLITPVLIIVFSSCLLIDFWLSQSHFMGRKLLVYLQRDAVSQIIRSISCSARRSEAAIKAQVMGNP